MPFEPSPAGTDPELSGTCTRRALLRGAPAVLVPGLLGGSPPIGLGTAALGDAVPAAASTAGSVATPAGAGSPLLVLFRAWNVLHARINDEATPVRQARRLQRELRATSAALVAAPARTAQELAAKVLALTEHGSFELPEALVEECAAIVSGAAVEPGEGAA